MDREDVAVEVEAIDRDIAVLTRRRELLVELLGTFDPAPPAPAPEPVAAAKKEAPRRAKKKPAAAEAGPFRCDRAGCDREFALKSALRRHITKTHGETPAKMPRKKPPLAVVPAAPAAPVDTRNVYRCSVLDCGAEFPTIVDLTEHVIVRHGRHPTPGERILVTPDSMRGAS